MKRQLCGLLVFGLMVLAQLSAQAQGQRLNKGDRIAICGDSITEQKLYSVYIENYLLMCKPAADLRVCQFGWSGERAPGFRDRMANDVLWFKPTVATTAYGMNDGLYRPYTEETGKTYRDAMKAVVKKFKDAGVKHIVVGSPGATDPVFMTQGSIPKQYNPVLAKLRDLAKEVAQEEGVSFANVHDTMLDGQNKAKAKFGEKIPFSGGDGFHPGPNGQLAMALAFLKAMGCDGDIGTITVDLGAGKAEATEGHKVLSTSGGTVEVESTRYPFCFYGKVDEASTRNAAEVLPFNEQLNRFRLVVKNAGADKLKVTWGQQTREFAAADLEKGINLAAEFVDGNPFSEPFARVEQKVKEKQNFETPLHKELMNKLPTFKRLVPGEQEAFEKIVAAAARRQAELADAASAAVTPVKHTLKIEK